MKIFFYIFASFGHTMERGAIYQRSLKNVQSQISRLGHLNIVRSQKYFLWHLLRLFGIRIFIYENIGSVFAVLHNTLPSHGRGAPRFLPTAGGGPTSLLNTLPNWAGWPHLSTPRPMDGKRK